MNFQLYYQASDEHYIFSDTVTVSSLDILSVYEDSKAKLNWISERKNCTILYAKAIWFDSISNSFCETVIIQ